MSDLVERARRWLFRRRGAYRDLFRGPNGDIVLLDLARFCRAHESTFHTDPRVHANLEGRREVFLRIMHHLQLSEADLWKLYARPEQDG